MIQVAPAVLFGFIAWLELRNKNLAGLDAAIVFLFTMFFVQTEIGHAVSDWVWTLVGVHSGGHQVTPPAPPAPPAGTSGQVHSV